jgi:hypothetical protein
MRKPEQRDLFPGALEMMILRTLKRQPLHGYALAKQIKQVSNDFLQIEEGSLYPALQRLLKAEGGMGHFFYQPAGADLQAYGGWRQALAARDIKI